jgi:opacity protein-like surface antigen
MSTVAFSQGTVGVGNGRDFSTGMAGVGLQYGITRFLAATANYMYYRYRFDPLVAVDPRFPRSLSRNGVQFGLTTSVPLLRR